ncbi:hypothetical protein TNCV_1621241 [Trichonephila clavipes]|nr:hypothetical protein TNCV_1621241 [Trichonephila clavipes]
MQRAFRCKLSLGLRTHQPRAYEKQSEINVTLYSYDGGISIKTSTKHHTKPIVLEWLIKYLRSERKVRRSNLPSFICDPGRAKEPHPSRATVVAPSIHLKRN